MSDEIQQNTILQQLQDLHLLPYGSSFSDIANITPEMISTQLANQYGLAEGILKPGMFSTISEDLINKLMPKTYTPFIESSTQPFLTNLTESLTGKSAVGASGGFAASSNIRDFEKKARDVYGKDVAGVVGSTKRQAQTSFDKIQEIVNQWRQTAQAI